jgi:hypothetical protein
MDRFRVYLDAGKTELASIRALASVRPLRKQDDTDYVEK